jgi:hypothetical protein
MFDGSISGWPPADIKPSNVSADILDATLVVPEALIQPLSMPAETIHEQIPKTERLPRRNEAGVDVAPGIFSEQAIHGLTDDWIVPMIVDEIIEKMIVSRES